MKRIILGSLAAPRNPRRRRRRRLRPPARPLARVGTPRLSPGRRLRPLLRRARGARRSSARICHPELKEKLLLCPEHGNIPEDICTLCHPEVAEEIQHQDCASTGFPSTSAQVQPEKVKGDDRRRTEPDQRRLVCRVRRAWARTGSSSTASSSRSSGSRRRTSRRDIGLQDRPVDRGGARPRAGRERRDGLRRQPLRRD